MDTFSKVDRVAIWLKIQVLADIAQRTLRGLAWGALAGAVSGALLAAGMQAWGWYSPFGQVVDIVAAVLALLVVLTLVGGLLGLAWSLLGRGLAWLYARPNRIARGVAALPRFVAWFVPVPLVAGAGALGMCAALPTWFPDSPAYFISIPAQALPLLAIEAALLAGLGVAITFRARWWVTALAALPGVAANMALVAFILWPGVDGYLAAHTQPVADAVRAAAPRLADPGLPGPYAVQSCTYGSGTDLRRPEYGAKACWTAPAVDLDGALLDFPRFTRDYFTWFWGFDFDRAPLNGRVWAPRDAAGPLPLVLVAHGNHPMGDYSDGGYAYLGEHLASQGFLVVSVDENYLNGFFLKDFGKAEMPVRAWVMLKHIQQWALWNDDPAHPFYHKVDMNHIAVMGHSRGGEAAALAAAINGEDALALYGLPETLKGYAIRAVVSIAPSEGSYRINGSEPRIEGASYFLIQGAHDADAYMVNGIRQYGRVVLAPDGSNFKAAVYLYRANHGQFNSGWGYGDAHPSWLLNTQALLSAAQQQQEAKIFVSAFLQAALMGRDEYRALLQQPWAALAQAGIPDVALGRYQDGRDQVLQSFENGAVHAGDLEGVRLEPEGFTSAELETLYTRDPGIKQNNTALRLNWSQSGAELRVQFPAGLTGGAQGVRFIAAPAGEGQPPLDLTVVLVDAAGRRATLALGDAAALPVLLPAQLTKSPAVATVLGMNRDFSQAERFLQSVRLPLERFSAEPDFDARTLTTLILRCDRLPAGEALVDEIGLY